MTHAIVPVLADCIRDGDYKEIASRLEDYTGSYAALYLAQACYMSGRPASLVADRLAAELKKKGTVSDDFPLSKTIRTRIHLVRVATRNAARQNSNQRN